MGLEVHHDGWQRGQIPRGTECIGVGEVDANINWIQLEERLQDCLVLDFEIREETYLY